MDCSAEYRKIKGSLLERQAKVKAGELIGVVNNPADTWEVLLLKKELEAFQISDSMICQDHFTGRLTLGEIQSAYTGFIKSLTEYRDFLKLDLYKEKEEAARRELNEYQIYISHLHNEVNLNKEELRLALSSYSREEILYKKDWFLHPIMKRNNKPIWQVNEVRNKCRPHFLLHVYRKPNCIKQL